MIEEGEFATGLSEEGCEIAQNRIVSLLVDLLGEQGEIKKGSMAA